MAQESEDVVREGNEVVLLRGKKLRDLLKQVHEDEVNLFENKISNYKTEQDKTQLLRESREAYETAKGLVDQNIEYTKPEPGDPTQDIQHIVDAYLKWVEVAVGFGIMVLQNLKLRWKYMKRLRAYGDTLVNDIEGLQLWAPVEYEKSARALMQGFVVYENFTLGCMVGRAGESSKLFAKAFQLKGETFTQLTQRHYLKLAEEEQLPAGKMFEELTDTQKLEVYYDIAKTWGREPFLDTTKLKVLGATAVGLMLFTAGMTVYDVAMSDHKLWTASKEVAEFGAGYVGGNIGEFVEKKVVDLLADPEVIATSELATGIVGLGVFAIGTVAGYYLAWATGEVIDNIQAWATEKHIGSGGKHTGGIVKVEPTDEPRTPPVDVTNVSIYRVPFPDSAAMARQIADQESG